MNREDAGQDHGQTDRPKVPAEKRLADQENIEMKRAVVIRGVVAVEAALYHLVDEPAVDPFVEVGRLDAEQEKAEESAEAHDDPSAPRFASIFVLDTEGTHLAAAYVDDESTKSVGLYFGWRSYFHGGPEDLPHFLLECPAWSAERGRFLVQVLRRAKGPEWLGVAGRRVDATYVLLGGSVEDRSAFFFCLFKETLC